MRKYCYNFGSANAETLTCSTASARTSSMAVAGFAPTVGYARRVTYDSRNRIVSSFDAAGLETKYVWDDKDRLVAKVEPGGVETSTARDALGHDTAVYGPAISTSFEADGKPKAGTNVPTTTKSYDDGMAGLAAQWYANTSLRGTPSYNTLSDLDEDWSGSCDSPSSCEGAGAIIPGSGFSGQLSGKYNQPTPGRLTLEANAGRVAVDDAVVIDRRDGPYPGAVREDRPLVWWRLGEATGSGTARDDAGNNTGTYSANGVTLQQPGPTTGADDTAAALNGSAGNVRVADQAALRFARKQPFTVEAWLKSTQTTGVGVIASKLPGVSPYRGWEFGISNGKPYFYLINTWQTNTVGKLGATNVADGAWHHVAMTYDGTSTAAGVRFFVDGQPDGTGTVLYDTLTGSPENTNDLYLGARAATTFWLNGALADVAVYPKALTQSRLAAHKTAATASSTSTTGPVIYNTPYPKEVVGESPVAYWRLSEASGTSAADSQASSAGTYSTGVTLGQTGAIPGDPATSASFNGTTGTVTVPDAPNLRFTQRQPFSVEAWVKPTSTGTVQVIASKMLNDTARRGWEVRLNEDGQPYFLLINTWSSDAMSVRGTTNLADGRWHHFVTTYDGGLRASGVKFFVDGRPDQTVLGVDTLQSDPSDGDPLTIGSRASSVYWFNGAMSDVAVYPQALTPDVAAIHHEAALTPYPRAAYRDKPVAYWRLAETTGFVAGDQTGASHGTYSGGLTLGQPGGLTGDPATATKFNGSGSFVLAPDAPGMRFTRTQPFSVDAWIKTTSTGQQVIASKMPSSAPNRGWEFLTASGKLYFLLISTWSSNAILRVATTNIADGNWHHVAVTYDGSSTASGVQFFVDGSPDAATTSVDSLSGDTTNTVSTIIGSRGGSAYFFNGTMSDVAVYPRTLSSDQVAAHAAAGKTAPAEPDPVHRVEVELQQFLADGHAVFSSDAADASFGPNYRLLTETTDPVGKVTRNEYADASAGIKPKHGLLTAVVQDPAGLALKTSTTYEAPGTSTYLRRTGKKLPAGNEWGYANYGGGEGPLAAACGVAGSTSQAGALKQRTDPAPQSGSPRVEQFVYDARGRLVGRRVGTQGTIGTIAWSCVGYDDQGRMASQSWPAFGSQSERTVTHSYAVAGDPLVNSVTDTTWPGQSITSRVDLLARTVSYTDILGNTTLTTFDRAGRVTQTLGPTGTRQTDYDSAGRVSSQRLQTDEVATATYDTVTGLLSTVTYPSGTGKGGNGTKLTMGYESGTRRRNEARITTAANYPITSDEVAFSMAGRIVSEIVDDQAVNTWALSYDAAARLVEANRPDDDFSYGYTSIDGCGPLGAAGSNTNRTSITHNGDTTSSCYDNADRLVSTTDTRYPTIAYDDHGNTTSLGDQTLTYDAADRHLTTSTSGAEPISVTYRRDPLDRIVERTTGTQTVRYGYGGHGDEPSLELDGDNVVLRRTLTLLGGVILTRAALTPSVDDVWSYPNLRSDIAAIVDGSGTKSGQTFTYDPFGQPLTEIPTNTSTDFSYGWKGGHQKLTEHVGNVMTVEIGVRQYVPGLGRFLSVDPIEGGCANAYVYVFGDPLNQSDLSGRGFFDSLKCRLSNISTFFGVVGVVAGAVAAVASAPVAAVAGGVALGAFVVGAVTGGASTAIACSRAVDANCIQNAASFASSLLGAGVTSAGRRIAAEFAKPAAALGLSMAAFGTGVGAPANTC
jgi:RHS repeat-associated protein